MTHSPKKSHIKLKDYVHFREVSYDNFPELKYKVFLEGHVTVDDVNLMIDISKFDKKRPIKGDIISLEPLINHMIDNTHMVEWWLL